LSKLELVQHARNTITDLTKLSAHFELVGEQGWALDDHENEDDVPRSPGAQLRRQRFGRHQHFGFAARFDGKYLQKITREAQKTARRLSENLGDSFKG
jgi:DNA-binding IclR family transcriptional regulator